MNAIETYQPHIFFSRCLVAACFIAALHVPVAKGQNLVPDPSFENYLTCPDNFSIVTGTGQLLTQSWSMPTIGSSDYYNTCSSNSPVTVPGNFFGYQYPFSGNGYAGIYVYSNNNSNYREYLQVALLSPLVQGQTYDVGFYTSLSDSADFYIKELGANLAAIPVTGNYTHQLPLVPQVVNTSGFLADQDHWFLISGSYTSPGGEQYLTIGNFYSDNSIVVGSFTSLGPDPASYYYIDSVYVSPCIPFNAGSDGAVSVCSTGAVFNLFDYIGNANTSGSWYDENGASVQPFYFNPAQHSSGVYYYTGGHGSCADTSSVTVTIVDPGNAGSDATVDICELADLFELIPGNPSTGGQWTDPNGSPFSNPFNPSWGIEGIYTYVVSQGMCSDTSYLDVSSNEPLQVSFSANAYSGCTPLSVVFTVSSTANDLVNTHWEFSDGSSSFSNPETHLFTDSGCYSIQLTVTNNGGCTMDTTINGVICVVPPPEADFSFTPSAPSLDDPHVSFLNLSNHADQYAWSINSVGISADQNISYLFPTEQASYKVCLDAYNSFGCADTTCKILSFSYGPSTLVVPNAFTPNDDGLNDRFTISAKWLETINLKIFNRWGNIVFETTDWNEGWDGTFKGEKEGTGTYVYSIDAHFLNGNDLRKDGFLTLIR